MLNNTAPASDDEPKRGPGRPRKQPSNAIRETPVSLEREYSRRSQARRQKAADTLATLPVAIRTLRLLHSISKEQALDALEELVNSGLKE